MKLRTFMEKGADGRVRAQSRAKVDSISWTTPQGAGIEAEMVALGALLAGG
ncbi:hypothetical protein [Streptomyces sp. NBC_00151]|uniref:hypothetical protein n=1 Tax=Streptomyces sp. NBC_00151 TaxID=2975669 RepID=UPI002DDB315D|nr:hypothetical protein [Streptomyces sp. NBC_00151]WRZ37788.1 hypothetical protein OG915_06840 [Streptomyces sp. NBC_00151]